MQRGGKGHQGSTHAPEATSTGNERRQDTFPGFSGDNSDAGSNRDDESNSSACGDGNVDASDGGVLENIFNEGFDIYKLWHTANDSADVNLSIGNEEPPEALVKMFDEVVKKEDERFSLAKFSFNNFKAIAKHCEEMGTFDMDIIREKFAVICVLRRHFVYVGDKVQELVYHPNDLMKRLEGGGKNYTDSKWQRAFPHLKVYAETGEEEEKRKKMSLAKWYRLCDFRREFVNSDDNAGLSDSLLGQMSDDPTTQALAKLDLVQLYFVDVVNAQEPVKCAGGISVVSPDAVAANTAIVGQHLPSEDIGTNIINWAKNHKGIVAESDQIFVKLEKAQKRGVQSLRQQTMIVLGKSLTAEVRDAILVDLVSADSS